MRLAFAVVALLFLVAVAPAAGEFGGRQLSLVGSAPTATFESSGTNGVAVLAVTVRNDSRYRGPVVARFVTDDGTTLLSNRPAKNPLVGKQRVRVRLARNGSADPRIGPRAVRRFKFRLTAEPIPTAPLTGTLVLAAGRSSGVSPLAVPASVSVTATEPSKSRYEKAKVKPASVTIVATRSLPSWIDDEDLQGDPRSTVRVEDIAAGATVASATIDEPVAADTGGRGAVRVTIPEVSDKATNVNVVIEPQKADERGTYDVSVPLDAAVDKSPAVAAKVVVRDWWVWALVANLIGAAIGYYLLRYSSRSRPKRVLRTTLVELQIEHDRDVRDRGSPPDPKPAPFALGVFPEDTWDCSIPARDKPLALKLYCGISSDDTQEKLDARTAEVRDLVALVEMWPAACAARDQMDVQKAKLPPGSTADNIRGACDRLIRYSPVPTSKQEAQAYLDAVDDQVKAVTAWLTAFAMLTEATRLYDRLPRDVATAGLPTPDPERWRPDLEAAITLADLERCDILEGLCRDVHILRALHLEFGDTIDVRAEERDSRVYASMVTAFRRDDVDFIRETIATLGTDNEPPVATAPVLREHFVTGLRIGDMSNFVLTAAITTAVYLVGIYDNEWGSVQDYIEALATGALGAAAINFRALLPFFQSFRPPKVA